jgi:hypothetical protein
VRRQQKRAEELIALFSARAVAPTNRQNQLLVKHLTCKESLELSDAVTSALARYHSDNVRALPAPTEILPALQ